MGMLAEASSASLAVICPAVSAAVSMALNAPCWAFTIWPLREAALMVAATICFPADVSPAAISDSVTVTSCVAILPSAPTNTW